jgi:hypothetical protein
MRTASGWHQNKVKRRENPKAALTAFPSDDLAARAVSSIPPRRIAHEGRELAIEASGVLIERRVTDPFIQR